MPLVTVKMVLAGEPKAVYTLASDMESYPRFMNSVDKITVLERGEGYTVTKWEVRFKGRPFVWIERDNFDAERFRIDYQLQEGDLKKFEGSWTFDTVPEGTLVTLTVDFAIGLPMFEALFNPVAVIVVRDNCESMLKGLKQHFEDN